MLLVGVVAVVAILILLAIRRTAAAGAVVVLSAPWLIIAYTYHVQSGQDVEGTALIVVLPVLWLRGAWMLDLARSHRGQPGPVQPV